MGGIIQGFIGGVGQGMADAGKMMLGDKLQKERDEADFLRRSELRKSENLADRKFRAGESELGRLHTTETAETKAGTDADAAKLTASARKLETDLDRASKEKIADKKATALVKASENKGGADTTNVRDAAALIAAGYPKDMANAVAHGALKQIKDEDTGDMVLVNALTNVPVGRLTTIGGKKQWLPEGDLPENAEVTAKHRKAANTAASDKAGAFSLDTTDFPSTKGDRKQWIRDESQRLANEERAGKQSKSPGIVSSQAGGETKTVRGKQMTKQAFIAAMVKQHGQDKMADIEATWNSIK